MFKQLVSRTTKIYYCERSRAAMRADDGADGIYRDCARPYNLFDFFLEQNGFVETIGVADIHRLFFGLVYSFGTFVKYILNGFFPALYLGDRNIYYLRFLC